MKDQLEAEMKKAAAAQDYEKAAELRDLIRDLKETTQKERKFERMPYTLPLAMDPQHDLAELAKVLGLPAPPQRIEGFDISNISGTFAVASLVSFRMAGPTGRTIAGSRSRRLKARMISHPWPRWCGGDIHGC